MGTGPFSRWLKGPVPICLNIHYLFISSDGIPDAVLAGTEHDAGIAAFQLTADQGAAQFLETF